MMAGSHLTTQFGNRMKSSVFYGSILGVESPVFVSPCHLQGRRGPSRHPLSLPCLHAGLTLLGQVMSAEERDIN